jgi:hypothetical protein
MYNPKNISKINTCIKYVIDIYDTSGIRALLTNACRICNRNRTSLLMVRYHTFIYCTIFYLRATRIKKILVIVHFNYFWSFPVFLGRQPQGVLLDRFPPFKPCANEFSLSFSYIKTLARP